ncbi:hypothetical protein [Candidatus Marinarcus aquaticus]|uniref:Uncharacterized protein n=1 Tax=Candidatus Marinarcus aquaticus TaxID=2044504 RepID=A0A4Q0XRE1_9BACT|nr:hypothetical protein [Candidatus Marinarcus aquaticus]RXJ60037.1 hypothetical protein CRV04_03215 [Candidatus Marinarcus aquaticus]
MLINQLDSLQQYTNDISKQMKQVQKLEGSSKSVNNVEVSNLPTKYIEESQMSEEQLIEKKIFEQILNTYSSSPLEDSDFWKFHHDKDTSSIDNAKKEMEGLAKELHSGEQTDRVKAFLNPNKEDLVKERTTYKTEIGFSESFNISTPKGQYNVDISFSFTQSYNRVDETDNSTDTSNILNLINQVNYKNMSIEVSQSEQNSTQNATLEDLNNWLDTQGEIFNEVYTSNETNENFQILNHFQSTTLLYSYL